MTPLEVPRDTYDMTSGDPLPPMEVRRGSDERYYLHDTTAVWPARTFVLDQSQRSQTRVHVSFSERDNVLLPCFKFERVLLGTLKAAHLRSDTKEGKLALVGLNPISSANFWKLVAVLSKCSNVDTTDFQRHSIVESGSFISINNKNAREAIEQLLSHNYLENLTKSEPDLVTSLGQAALYQQRAQALDKYRQLLLDRCEDETGVWQPFFEKNPWIFGLGLDYRFLSKMKRELKTDLGDENNSGQSFSDFGLGPLTDYSVLVEMKTPLAQIFMSTAGDSNTWKVSEKLANSLVQVLSQKTSWVANQKNSFPVDPKCLLIYGASSQIDNKTKRMTFEMFRRDSRNVEVVTYDELFKRAYYILHGKPMPGDYLNKTA